MYFSKVEALFFKCVTERAAAPAQVMLCTVIISSAPLWSVLLFPSLFCSVLFFGRFHWPWDVMSTPCNDMFITVYSVLFCSVPNAFPLFSALMRCDVMRCVVAVECKVPRAVAGGGAVAQQLHYLHTHIQVAVGRGWIRVSLNYFTILLRTIVERNYSTHKQCHHSIFRSFFSPTPF